MKPLSILAGALVVIGGLNWGLVALAEFDLVAWVVGLDFGETNALSRIVYGLVGISAVYLAATRRQSPPPGAPGRAGVLARLTRALEHRVPAGPEPARRARRLGEPETRERFPARREVVDDRLRVVRADHAAHVALDLFRHLPRLGQVLVGHVAQLGHVAADVAPSGSKRSMWRAGL